MKSEQTIRPLPWKAVCRAFRARRRQPMSVDQAKRLARKALKKLKLELSDFEKGFYE